MVFIGYVHAIKRIILAIITSSCMHISIVRSAAADKVTVMQQASLHLLILRKLMVYSVGPAQHHDKLVYQ